MSIGDFLKGVGGGLAKAGRVAGTVLEPIGKAVAEEESGELPEMQKEKRQQKQKAQDEVVARRAKFLENQLALDQQYGTLTPEKRTQLNQEYQSLGAPKKEPSIWQHLLKGGATYQQPSVKYSGDATPEGGTAAADEKLSGGKRGVHPVPGIHPFKGPDGQYYQPMYDGTGKIVNEIVENYTPPVGTEKALPGVHPFQAPDKKWYQPMADAQGNIINKEIENYTAPAPKPGQPKVGTVNGRPAWELLTATGWIDPQTQQPIPSFEPAPNYAQVAPSLRAVEVVNPNSPTETIYETIPEATRTRAQGKGSIDYRLQMPTGAERGRADLAMSAREQLKTMKSILTSRHDLFGPIAGRLTNFEQWVGSQDPDAQRFRSGARIAADHLAGVFGGRSEAALQGIYDVVGKNLTNPAAAIAGIDQMDKAAEIIQGRGTGPIPQTGASPVGDLIKPKTGAPKKKWSKSKYAAANPGKDVNVAAQQAQAQGKEVIP